MVDKTETAPRAERPAPFGLGRLRLRFRDPALELAFRDNRFRHNVGNIRFAFLAGIALWVAWGVLLRPHILAVSDRRLDMLMRFGVFIPMLLVGLGLTFTPFFRRIWQGMSVAIAAATLLAWMYYVSHVLTLPPEYGYVGVILITAFTYTLLRLRFVLVVLITLIGIAVYLPYAFTARSVADVTRVLATLYLVSFGMLGAMAAYRLEQFSRQVFLRERQVDQERLRSDALLVNILPQAIVDQLKASPGERIAQGFDQVSVIFADAVGSTEQGARSSPEEFAAALDALFRRFDQIVDRHGLEKIKTIGDAYMAVAGAPVPMTDHAVAAVEAALDMVAESVEFRWPSGAPIEVHAGVASGPAVAGVIGDRRFAYDLWGDTVNLASRLEERGEPGRVLVSESTARQLSDRYEFGPPQMVDLKGKGPTPILVLVGRRTDVPVTVRTREVLIVRTRHGLKLAAALGAAVIALAGCTEPGTGGTPRGPGGKETIVVGVSGAFAENQIVAEMYAQVLEGAGYSVERQFDLRSREISQSALESGQIDVKPEYLSSLLLFLDRNAEASGDPVTVARKNREVLQQRGIKLLTPSPAQDTNTFVANATTARQFGLTTMSSLAPVAGRLTFGGPPECPQRPFCIAGLNSVYGILFWDFTPLDAGGPETIAALKSDEVQIGLLFSTDPSIEKNGFVPLVDDKHLQNAENITPVIRSDKLDDEVQTLLDAVSAQLTTGKMTDLVGKVVIDRQNVASVARGFLVANGLA